MCARGHAQPHVWASMAEAGAPVEAGARRLGSSFIHWGRVPHLKPEPAYSASPGSQLGPESPLPNTGIPGRLFSRWWRCKVQASGLTANTLPIDCLLSFTPCFLPSFLSLPPSLSPFLESHLQSHRKLTRAKDDLGLDLPASMSQGLGLQVCAPPHWVLCCAGG